MKNKLLTSLLATTMFVGTATAQTANSNSWGVKNPLFDKVAGKLNLTANVGYVYNFDSKWDSELAPAKPTAVRLRRKVGLDQYLGVRHFG